LGIGDKRKHQIAANEDEDAINQFSGCIVGTGIECDELFATVRLIFNHPLDIALKHVVFTHFLKIAEFLIPTHPRENLGDDVKGGSADLFVV
jgi:hypothetical protein